MKVRVYSDLHLEVNDFRPPTCDADVVVLAGDIHTKGRGVEWARANFDKPVIYVLGNHEFWSGHLRYTLDKMRDLARGSNVYILENESIMIDGVRFLGGTLWTDFRSTGNQPLAMMDSSARGPGLKDFYKIRTAAHRRKITPYDLIEKNLQTRLFIESEIEKDATTPTVVVTHHAPSILSEHPKKGYGREECKGSHAAAAYVNRHEHMLNHPIVAWIHGHVHWKHDYVLGDTRVITNPYGYVEYGEVVEGFDVEGVFEIDTEPLKPKIAQSSSDAFWVLDQK